MPTGVFDASLITQRARAKAESNSFINRIQNPTNPTTSYGPLTGIYDNSEVNRVNNGQMKYFQRNGACTVAYIGCPCTVLTPSGQVANNVVIVAPGVVDGIQANYGSVIVTWNVPTGTAPFTYTLLAESQTNPLNNRTNTGITTNSYTFPTYTAPPPPEQLVAGDRYLFKVTAFNPLPSPSAGSALSLFNAPFEVPVVSSIDSSPADPNTILIRINEYMPFTPNSYIIKQYVNNATTSTTITGVYSQGSPGIPGGVITLSSGLSTNNVYAFQVQLYSGNNYTSLTVKSTPPTEVYPAGPNMQPVTDITSTTAKINYENYKDNGGFDLTTGDAQAIITGPGSYSVQPGSLNNTSVIVTGLTPLTQYLDSDPSLSLKISFRKTIQGNVITSASSAAVTFKTNGLAPTGIIVTTPIPPILSPLTTYGADTARIEFNNYTSSNTGEFNFNTATLVIPGAANPGIQSISIPNTVNINQLISATTYNNCKISLVDTATTPSTVSDESASFTIITKADAPSSLAFVSSTFNGSSSNLILSFTKPSGLGTLTGATASYNNGSDNFSSVSIFSQSEIEISGLPQSTTYDNITITVTDGTYTSINSSVLSSATTAAQPPPSIQNLRFQSATWTTALFRLDSYSFPSPDPPPNNATVTSTTDGTLPDTFTQQVGYDEVEITALLDPGTGYNGASPSLSLTVTNGSNTSPSANFPPFTTNSANASSPSVPSASVGQNSITYEVDVSSYTWTPTASYVTAKISGTTQKLLLTSSYSPPISPGSPATVLVTSLLSGTTYELVRLALTDNTSNFTNFADPGAFTTRFSAPQNVQVPNSGINTTSVKITFESYSSFTISPFNSTVSDGVTSLTLDTGVDSYGQTFVTVIGLTFGTPYTGYNLVLQSNDGKTAASVTISPPFTPTYPQPKNVDPIPGSGGVTINYDNYGMYFTPTNFNSSILDESGNPIGTIDLISSNQMNVTNLNTGQLYSNCTIILSNGSDSSLPSEPFSFTPN
jgi:hypothetical protein